MNLDAFCHNSQSYRLLEPTYRQLIADLSPLASDRQLAASFTPFEGKQGLWKVMTRNRIQIQPELFEKMEKDDSLEMWVVPRADGPQRMRFVLAMGKILSLSSYSITELATIPWNELFWREERYSVQITAGVLEALKTNASQFRVTDWHDVYESLSPNRLKFQVAVTQITPFKVPNGDTGIFALVKARPTSAPAERVGRGALTVVGKKRLSSGS